MRTEALKKAQEAYEQKVIRVTVKLVKGQDDDLIQILEAKDNKQGFIKDCIRKALKGTSRSTSPRSSTTEHWQS